MAIPENQLTQGKRVGFRDSKGYITGLIGSVVFLNGEVTEVRLFTSTSS